MLPHCLTLALMSVIYSRTTPGNRISLIAGDYVWAEVTDLRFRRVRSPAFPAFIA